MRSKTTGLTGASVALLFAVLLGAVLSLPSRGGAEGPGAPNPVHGLLAQIDPDPGEKTKQSDAPLSAARKPSSRGFSLDDDWVMYGGIGLIIVAVAVVAIVIYKKQQTTPTAPIHVSDTIGGYRLQNLMMTGQTSQVWEVVETASGRHFAIKLLLPEKLQDPEHRQLLFHEASVGMELAHQNIIRIVKVVKDPHNPHFIMEYFPAGNLKLRIMHKKWDFIKEHAQNIFKQAATALAYMNASGWVHRDVKPDNLMVNSAGEVRLIDFALAQRIAKRGLFRRRKGRSAGTRSYMSPEQIRGEPLDGRADIYSFGISMYEVITGRPPFRAGSPTELLTKQIVEKPISPLYHNPEVTEECADLIMRMIAKKREDRPRDFHEVLMKLRSIKVFKGEKDQVAQKST